MPLPASPSPVQWIDRTAGLAYIIVRGQLGTFQDFLGAVDRLTTHPDWHPGMPVIEDLRQCPWVPPESSIEEWRAFVTSRERLLHGCRWAVVRHNNRSPVVNLLYAAAEASARSGVTLQQFTNMLDAHLWVKAPASPD